MKVLGIDPGTRNLGWGFIEVDEKLNWQRVEHDCFNVPANVSFFGRLHLLSERLAQLVQLYKPDVAVIEAIFLGKNVDSAFKLGHIRGVCAVRCQEVGARVVEYAPRTVKKQITGSGHADKVIVQNFLYQQLSLQNKGKTLDASDALALALCHILLESIKAKHAGLVIG